MTTPPSKRLQHLESDRSMARPTGNSGDANAPSASSSASDQPVSTTALIPAKRGPDAVLTERVSRVLESFDIKATRQRVDVAAVLLEQHIHMSADEVFTKVESMGSTVSRATVYNTLSLMVERGILAQVIVDPTRVFYDSNTSAHHHVFDTDTGRLTDVSPGEVNIGRLPALPEGKRLAGVDVIIRVTSDDSRR